MEYIRFGNTGMKVSRICLGCMSYGQMSERSQWVLNEEQSRPYIQRALELGINFFDTANVYANGTSEEYLGRALKDFAKRDEVLLARPVGIDVGRIEKIYAQFQRALDVQAAGLFIQCPGHTLARLPVAHTAQADTRNLHSS